MEELKFRCDAKLLAEVVKRLGRLAQPVVSIAAPALVTATKEALSFRVVAHDGWQVELSYPCDGVTVPGSGTINLRDLADLLAGAAGEVEVELTNRHRLRVARGEDGFDLQGFRADVMPAPLAALPAESWAVTGATILAALRATKKLKCAPSSGFDAKTIAVDASGVNVVLMQASGERSIRYVLGPADETLACRRYFMNAVTALWASTNLLPTMVLFRGGAEHTGVEWVCPKYNVIMQGPNNDRDMERMLGHVFPEPAAVVSVDAGEVCRLLKLVGPVARRGRVFFKAAGDVLYAAADDDLGNRARAKAPITLTGEPRSWAIEAAMLAQALAAAGDGYVRIGLLPEGPALENAPVTITPVVGGEAGPVSVVCMTLPWASGAAPECRAAKDAAERLLTGAWAS